MRLDINMIVFWLHRSTHSTSPPLCWTKCATTSLWSRCGTRHLAQPLMMRYGSSDGPVLYDQLCTCTYSPLCCSYTCMYICSKILGDILLHCPSQYFHTMILLHVHVQSCIRTLGYTGSICKFYSCTQLYYSIYMHCFLCAVAGTCEALPAPVLLGILRGVFKYPMSQRWGTCMYAAWGSESVSYCSVQFS